MSEAGATRDAIRGAICACVEGQTPEEPVRSTFIAVESRGVSIRRRMTGWADAATASRPEVQTS